MLKRVVGWCVLCGENGPYYVYELLRVLGSLGRSRRGFRRGGSVPGGASLVEGATRGNVMPHFYSEGLGFYETIRKTPGF